MTSSVQNMFVLLWGKNVGLSLCLLELRVIAAFAKDETLLHV